MAIHDVDKDNHERHSPLPNAHDSQDVGKRMAHGTNSVNYVTDATDTDLIQGILAGILRPIMGKSTTLASPNSSGSSTSTVVTHNLGFAPLVFAFVSFSTNGTKFPIPYLSPILPTTGTIGYQISMEVTTTDITFFHRDIAQASNVTDYITYYIMQQAATYVV